MWDAVKKPMDPAGGERERGREGFFWIASSSSIDMAGAVRLEAGLYGPSQVLYPIPPHYTAYRYILCACVVCSITYPLTAAHPRISPCPMMKNFVAAGYGRTPGPEAPGRAWSPKWIDAAAISGALSAADCMIPLSTFPGECGGGRLGGERGATLKYAERKEVGN